MFTRSAPWYDLVYGAKDYAGEAARLRALIAALRPGAATLLDVACGTGRHLEHLVPHLRCEGTDLDAGLLAVAAARLPGVPLTVADMAELDLGRRFDVVTCLFSAVGYLVEVDRLRAAVDRMAAHLAPGGVLLVEPWILPEAWEDPGRSFVAEARDGDRLVVRVGSGRRDGRVSSLRFHYVAARAGAIETVDEEHVLGLFTRDEYLEAVAAAGLAASWVDEGPTDRGLVVGVRADG